jgi:DDE superfamily endonuclease
LGVKIDFPGLNCVLPFKKKNPGRGKVGVKAQELPDDPRLFNKTLAKERIVVEHTNSRVKKFLIWGGEFRNRAKRYDVMTDIVSGLINFRILGTLIV